MATEIINFKMNLEERIEKMMEKRGEVWKCIVCGKVAQDSKARGNLKRHVETHLEGVSHPCDICGHSSTSSGGLYQHKAKKHSELRPDRLYKQKKLAQAINNHIDLNLISRHVENMKSMSIIHKELKIYEDINIDIIPSFRVSSP